MILLSFSILTAISQNKEKVMINKDGSFNVTNDKGEETIIFTQ